MTLVERITELAERHGSIRAAARVLMVDHTYLYRLSIGEKDDPGDDLLRRMKLRRVVTYERTDGVATARCPVGECAMATRDGAKAGTCIKHGCWRERDGATNPNNARGVRGTVRTQELRAFLDGGDAGREGERWLSDIARQVGAEHGRIERFQGHLGEPGADNHWTVLWDGTQPRAIYMVLRDDFNRSKLVLWERPAGVPPVDGGRDDKA